MPSCTTVDLLRHGHCAGGDIFRGCGSDSSLTEKGWQQMSDALAGLSGWQQIVTSPLQRCRSFAAASAHTLNIPLKEDNHWREIDFGCWEGEPVEAVWGRWPEQVAAYFINPDQSTPHGGECLAAFQQRVQQGWRRLLGDYRNQHILLVQHGGIMRLLLTLLFNRPIAAMSRLVVPYGCLMRLKVWHLPNRDYVFLMPHKKGE